MKQSIYLTIILGLTLGASSILAQSVPNLINYQGKLTDAAGELLPNGIYGVAFRIWNKKDAALPGNTLVWGQEYDVALQSGIFNVILGAPGGLPLTNAAVNDLSFAFTEAERYIGLTMTRGTNGVAIPSPGEIIPRQQVLTAPYAVTASYASVAQNVVNGVPVGSVMPFAASVAPDGWLFCNGSAVSRTVYSNLFAVVGATYGNGDGSTSFNLPDYRGRSLVGMDGGQAEFDALGETGGAKTHTLTVAELPSHSHTYAVNDKTTGESGGQPLVPETVRVSSYIHNNTSSVGSGQPHNIMQPFTVVNYIIKY